MRGAEPPPVIKTLFSTMRVRDACRDTSAPLRLREKTGQIGASWRGREAPAPSERNDLVAGSTGFEPATSGLTVARHPETIGGHRHLSDRIQRVSRHASRPFRPMVSL